MVITAEFQKIPDFPQCLADKSGNIYRTYNNGQLRKLSQRLDKDGYFIIRLKRGNRKVCLKAHRLICGAFHGLCPPNMMIRHLDGNRTNNIPDNLYWGTAQDNSDDKKLHGTMCVKEKHGRAKLTQAQVDLIRLQYANGQKQQTIAKKFGVSQSVISYIVRKETWK